MITRALQPLECYLPKPLAEAFLIDWLRVARSSDVVKSPRMSYILGHFYQKIV